MPLPKKIIIKIEELSSKNKQDHIADYLKPKLGKGKITPEDLYEYVQVKHDVVHAIAINGIGVVLADLSDKKLQLSAGQFFLLAAERDNAWGCHNYAEAALLGSDGVKQSKEKALLYAKKAIDITKDTVKKNEHKRIYYIYAAALYDNEDYVLSFTTIKDYLTLITAKKDRSEKKIKEVVQLCGKLIEKLQSEYEFIQEDCKGRLSTLQSIISCLGDYQELLATIQNKARLLTGTYYEILEQDSKAWLTYCEATDRDTPFYKEVVNARKELLKKFIDNQLDSQSNSELKSSIKQQDLLLLPNGIPLSLNFSKPWKQEYNSWFHSVDEAALKERYEKRSKHIEKLIEAKKEEITLVKQAITKKIGDLGELKEIQQKLEAELDQWQKAKEKINDIYQQNTAEGRQILRCHKTEAHFFDPKHLKKPKVLRKLKELTFGIIDQRFSLNPALSPFDLVNYSSRMLITAERVFQEAVIALSGDDSTILGIPKMKERPWQLPNGYKGINIFGPTERYEVVNTIIEAEHHTKPKKQRLGDSYMPRNSTYSNDIYPFFLQLSANDPAKEKLIAHYLIRYSKTHQTITLRELQNLCKGATKSDVSKFNQIAYLIMEKEQAQWHSATNTAYQGMSVAQARALRMLETGALSLKEVFKNDVLFGVYSQTDIINYSSRVTEACRRINELYTQFVLPQHPDESMKFFKSKIKQETERTPVLTRQQAHEDLRYVYGGETDSDGDGYDTDLEI